MNKEHIVQAWCAETTREWKPDNPAWGQCAVTALLVQDELGGKLMRGTVELGGWDGPSYSHYWNRLPDGTELDLTAGQFPVNRSVFDVDERDRDYVLSFPDTAKRYALLRERYLGVR